MYKLVAVRSRQTRLDTRQNLSHFLLPVVAFLPSCINARITSSKFMKFIFGAMSHGLTSQLGVSRKC